MISWVTLFLALAAGPQEVEVAADDSVARVELWLDGEPAATLEGAPWRAEVDLGERLAPHELEAVARDAEGGTLARIRQGINVPRPRGEVRIALTEGKEGAYRAARLVWETAEGRQIRDTRVFFDGRPLPVPDPEHIPLPAYDAGRVHQLAAEVIFEGRLRGHAAVAFGGPYGGTAESALTSVVLAWEGDGPVPEPPSAEQAEGWVLHRGRPAPVFAVDRPPADVVIVRDRAAARALSEALPPPRDARSGRETHLARIRQILKARLGGGVEPGDRVRFVCAVAQKGDGGRRALFPTSADFGKRIPGLGWTVAGLDYCREEGAERLADAVAASAMTLAAGGRPRAVLLVTHPDTADVSRHGAAEVREYLERLQVPLGVWSAGEPGAVRERWGEVEPVGGAEDLRKAVEELRGRLDRQVVVWLEGWALPQEIGLAPAAAGWRLAR
jgi:hypothetical protein